MSANLPEPASVLACWTGESISRTCRTAYRTYRAELEAHYTTYFQARPEERGRHRYGARDLARALPPHCAHLADGIPPGRRHIHHRSAFSSQALALAVLGRAAELDRTLGWLAAALQLPDGIGIVEDGPTFECAVSPDLLNEHPRQTDVDFFVRSSSTALCLEAKWSEEGLGGCSCADRGGDAATGRCSENVKSRPLYWSAARDHFRLAEARHGVPCPISHCYQAVRNVAAARALAGPRKRAVFALVYDEQNPYFRQTGDWPGWPEVLSQGIAAGAGPTPVTFRAVGWRALLRHVPPDDDLRAWLRLKHRLEVRPDPCGRGLAGLHGHTHGPAGREVGSATRAAPRPRLDRA